MTAIAISMAVAFASLTAMTWMGLRAADRYEEANSGVPKKYCIECKYLARYTGDDLGRCKVLHNASGYMQKSAEANPDNNCAHWSKQ